MKYIKKFNESYGRHIHPTVVAYNFRDKLEKIAEISSGSEDYQEIHNMILNGEIKSAREFTAEAARGSGPCGGYHIELIDGRLVTIRYEIYAGANFAYDNYTGNIVYVKECRMSISDSTFDDINHKQRSFVESLNFVGDDQGYVSGTKKRSLLNLLSKGHIFISKSNLEIIFNYIKEWYDTRENDYLSKIPKRDFRLEEFPPKTNDIKTKSKGGGSRWVSTSTDEYDS